MFNKGDKYLVISEAKLDKQTKGFKYTITGFRTLKQAVAYIMSEDLMIKTTLAKIIEDFEVIEK